MRPAPGTQRALPAPGYHHEPAHACSCICPSFCLRDLGWHPIFNYYKPYSPTSLNTCAGQSNLVTLYRAPKSVYAAVFKLLTGDPSDAVTSEFHNKQDYSAKVGRLELPPKFIPLFHCFVYWDSAEHFIWRKKEKVCR